MADLAQPQAFQVMAKPTGARCNLDCAYCFFLKKDSLYPGSTFRMTDEVMESYVRQTIRAQQGSQGPISIAWQGGEPTLMGVDFFRRVMAVERKYVTPGMLLENTIQTNGILIDEEWCRFLQENRFLVGLSLDGPAHLHDAYRRDKGGGPTCAQVVKAVRLMQEHQVDFNILCAVNAANSVCPLEVYRFFRDEIGARYLQFIPIVERQSANGDSEGTLVTVRSVQAEAYGSFLTTIFDEWVQRDVGTVFVPFFDAVLASYVFGTSSVCVLRPTCGDALVLEHNGDLYSCDHFVEPRHLLGNITETPLADLSRSAKQHAFGDAKSESLPGTCRACRFLFTCHGECPRNRVLTTADGEPGLNWLCAGLKQFFAHTEPPMRTMADLVKRGRYADEIMRMPQKEVPNGKA
jgi:uncharacterized protein